MRDDPHYTHDECLDEMRRLRDMVEGLQEKVRALANAFEIAQRRLDTYTGGTEG